MTQSPCINVCKMDELTGLCTGCFRTIAEITIWSRADDKMRTDILASISQRRQKCSQQATKLIARVTM